MKTEKTKRINLLFRLGCFLLAVTSFTCVAFARYLSAQHTDANSDVAKLACSIRVDVDHSSSYSFFNTEYLINNNIMNRAQITGFTVNNCNIEDDGTYSEPCGVDLSYELVLYIPATFAEVAAFQITSPASFDGVTPEQAVTPLYLVKDFVTAEKDKIVVNGNNTEYSQDSIATLGETFEKIVGGEKTVLWKSDRDTELLIEKIETSAQVQYVYQCFDHDPSNQGLGVASRLAPLYAIKKFDNLEFYRIRIKRPEFVIAQDVREDHRYNLRMLSTGTVPDGDLNMQFSDFDRESTTYYYNGSAATLEETAGGMWNISYETVSQNTYVGTLIQKDYPIRLNAIFMQTKIEANP